MWPIISAIIQFVGYVFAFWLMWRVFDGVLHITKKPKNGECPECVRYEKQIRDLNQRTRNAEQQAKEKHQLDAIAEEAVALGQLNIASQIEIEEISGIGPIKAAKIISHRPYFSWVHFKGVEPSSKNAILRWAKLRLGLIRPRPRHNPWSSSRY